MPSGTRGCNRRLSRLERLVRRLRAEVLDHRRRWAAYDREERRKERRRRRFQRDTRKLVNKMKGWKLPPLPRRKRTRARN